MERVLASELVQYLESCGLLSDRQFGFRKHISTEDQMLLVYSDVSGMVDDGFIVDLIMLDFSNAFDVISHTVLLQKLRSIGVPAVLLNWIWGFLSNRSMCVTVGGVLSEPRRVSSGVPQGSVLGLILFLVNVNFLTHGLVLNYGAFADVYLQYHRNAVIDGRIVLQTDLDKLTDISSSWNLSVNVGKCVVLRFSRRFVGCNVVGNELEYKIGNRILEIVENHRHLRVIVDSGLKIHVHVRDLVCKAA